MDEFLTENPAVFESSSSIDSAGSPDTNSEAVSSDERFCGKCGHEISSENDFCTHCGAKQEMR